MSPGSLKLAIFVPFKGVVTETFIRAHVEQLPFETVPYYGVELAITDHDGRPVWSWGRWFGVAARRLAPRLNDWVVERLLARHLRGAGVDKVLAEYGPTGAFLIRACVRAKIPLFVHFHGYDASVRDVLATHRGAYQEIFAKAAGVIAVSAKMQKALEDLGALRSRLFLNPYGVDPERFKDGAPAKCPPHFLAVGRLVEKKAPYLSILAFHEVVRQVPDARLTIVGEGPLVGPCRRLIQALGLEHAVTLAGWLEPAQVSQLMRNSRAFVQHSVVAENGDCEGTPVAIVEAQMTGVPVVATCHAGIGDLVLSGVTGYLVEEGDVVSMSAQMLKLANDPQLAARMGRAARSRAEKHFALEKHLAALADMIRSNPPVSPDQARTA